MVVPTSVRDSMLNMNVENDMVVLGLWASVNYGADPFCPILLAKKTQRCSSIRIKILVNNNNNTTDYHSQ